MEEGAGDPFQVLAKNLEAKIDSSFKSDFLSPRFRGVGRELNVSAQVIEEAVCWWLDEHATGFQTEDWVRNKGGYLNQILPNLVQDYLVARERQAQELGVDPAILNYHNWLKIQEGSPHYSDEDTYHTQEEGHAA